jgi:hypothetical protein
MRNAAAFILLGVALGAVPALVRAQDAPAVAETRAEAADEGHGPTPGGAFIRSLAVPGWGQAAVGSPFRGGVYFAAQTGSAYMIFVTHRRVGIAAERAQRRSAMVIDSLSAAAVTDPDLAARIANPDTLAHLVRQDRVVRHARTLAEARRQQREDWIAWAVFWTLASAIDAYVAAHLADFPAGIAVAPGTDGAVFLAASVRLPQRRRW